MAMEVSVLARATGSAARAGTASTTASGSGADERLLRTCGGEADGIVGEEGRGDGVVIRGIAWL